MTHRPTRTRLRAIRHQVVSFFVLSLVAQVGLWSVLDRALCHRWLLEPGEALMLVFLVGGTTGVFWWIRRFSL